MTARAATPIAIIGQAGRFPGAPDLGAYRDLIVQGRSGICRVPADRWDAEAFCSPGRPRAGKMNSTRGGFIPDVRSFDPAFFNITAAQACAMDPQQRVVLETSWAALESANLPADRLAGSATGVFIGVSNYDYGRMMSKDMESITAHSGLGTVQCIVANRLSYFLRLTGPSLTIDTACSSSLVSVHLACRSLACGECDLAFAGGVNLILSPEVSIGFARSGMLSPDGECKAFDAAANGYVRAEGCGIVLLKRLDDARADRDPVIAVIMGSAVNHNAMSNGLSAPSAEAQQKLVRLALQGSGVEPYRVGYVEAHGTGTPLGDPIEMEALKAVFLPSAERTQRCAVGSVKNNIGHLESAAGIAGLVKAAMLVRDGVIPVHCNFDTLNPLISLEGSPLHVPRKSEPWQEQERIAGVSSFGFGGANAHVVLRNEARTSACPRPTGPYPVVLSAKSGMALRALLAACGDWLDRETTPDIAEIGRISALGRTHFATRWGVAVHHAEELRSRIEDSLARPADAAPGPGDTTHPAVASFCAGHDVDWTRFYSTSCPMEMQFPGHPFLRRSFWMN